MMSFLNMIRGEGSPKFFFLAPSLLRMRPGTPPNFKTFGNMDRSYCVPPREHQGHGYLASFMARVHCLVELPDVAARICTQRAVVFRLSQGLSGIKRAGR